MVETFTIRIYNSQTKKDIEESYKRCKDYYPSKNAFLMDCMVRGVFNFERVIFGIKNVKDIDELYAEIMKTTENLNSLIKLSERNAKENLAHLTVNQKLLSNNFNMLIGLSENKPKKIDTIESGFFDNLPARYKIILNDMLEVLKKGK